MSAQALSASRRRMAAISAAARSAEPQSPEVSVATCASNPRAMSSNTAPAHMISTSSGCAPTASTRFDSIFTPHYEQTCIRPLGKIVPSPMEIEKIYEPGRFEPHWARWWIEQGVFHADRNHPGPVFSMVIPPPNVTGSLHMGHMLDHTIMDACTRWHRMKGDNTLWLPGTDHAGIATQMVVERQLAEQGTDRHQLGREEFLRRVWAWKEKYGGRITEQMKAIGDAVDWTREQFTFSPELSRAVTEAFIRLHARGLIYRGEYMISWCPRCRTALSDLETAHNDTQGSLWHIRYPVTASNEYLTV